MNLKLLFPLLITSVVTMLGWFILHWFAKRRDIANKQKELRINYLIEAWRKLEYAANRNEFDKIECLEKPIADIQLFGTKKQISLAIELATAIVENQDSNLTGLLEELRGNLRKELNLEKVSTPIKIFRVNNSKESMK
ncbi:hypothetical protein [Flavobacterium cerinum]|uniref:Uncharacterized protein n=1 Tax=Flavobacterium cerinum TaxID=2502784 RepID=A0A3S3SDV4_9FLAO|nr:hypothetical protein [Flavobacterium cerinum]RWW99550.1 hypothetical protein EPI11_11395 [Flavobacterium cerinum]